MNQEVEAQEERQVSDPLDGHTDPAFLDQALPEAEGTIVAEAPGNWRAGNALKALRRQVDRAFPGRNIGNDGTVGDASHQSRSSDHNPWIREGGTGVVSAIDVTHDSASGCDANRIVLALHASRDPRIKYLIWNRRIANSSAIGAVPAWTWRAYGGSNPHNHHFHMSVKAEKRFYDDESPWTIESIAEAAADSDADDDAALTAALASLAEGVDLNAPALPQMVAMQDALTELFAYRGEAWPEARDDEVAAEAPRNFEDLKAGYEQLFATAQVRPEYRGTVAWYLKMLRRGKARYEEVTAATGAPWWFVGIVHAMEASFSFNGHLHNGDPLVRRTVQVPRNRPPVWNPPSDWKSSAVDALQYQGHAGQSDWSIARSLYRFEGYNGYGYYAKGINSPYLWSFSNHYSKGKFVADHRYDPNAVSKQCGTAVMLRALIDAGDVTVG